MDRGYVEEELAMAERALDDAKTLRESDGSPEGAVNRLYYAAFHGAQAVLYDRGIDPGSHGGVRNRFGEHIVMEGDATTEQGRLLTTLADLRQQADYGYELLDVELAPLYERTSHFVDDMIALSDIDSPD